MSNKEEKMNEEKEIQLFENEINAYIKAIEKDTPDLWDKISAGFDQEVKNLSNESKIENNLNKENIDSSISTGITNQTVAANSLSNTKSTTEMSSEEFVNDQRINFISKKKKRNIGHFSLLAAALLAIVIVVPIFSSINNPKSDNGSNHIGEKMYSNSIELSDSVDESKTENINDKMANAEENQQIEDVDYFDNDNSIDNNSFDEDGNRYNIYKKRFEDSEDKNKKDNKTGASTSKNDITESKTTESKTTESKTTESNITESSNNKRENTSSEEKGSANKTETNSDKYADVVFTVVFESESAFLIPSKINNIPENMPQIKENIRYELVDFFDFEAAYNTKYEGSNYTGEEVSGKIEIFEEDGNKKCRVKEFTKKK